MGWFLTSNKKKTKKKTKRGKSADPSWDLPRLVFAIALGWHFGTQQLEAHVSTSGSREITAQDIVFSEHPEMMSPSKINQLRDELVALIASSPMNTPETEEEGLVYDSPLNRRGLEQAAEMLRGRQDIVRELRQVRRMPDGTIFIDLSFRVPAALIQMRHEGTNIAARDGFHVIDNQGYQMYGPRSRSDVPAGLPLIEGVGSNYRPQDIHDEFQWQGAEVEAGLSLIETLRSSPALSHIGSIEVNHRDERGRIRLVIETEVRPRGAEAPVRCLIVWGLPPGQEGAIEPDPDRKIAALETLLAHERYRSGDWTEVWINTGDIRFAPAITAR